MPCSYNSDNQNTSSATRKSDEKVTYSNVSNKYKSMGKIGEKTTKGKTTYYSYDEDGNLEYELTDGEESGYLYVYGNDLICKMHSKHYDSGLVVNNTNYYFHDINKNVSAVYDKNGSLLSSYQYDPYGHIRTGQLLNNGNFSYAVQYGGYLYDSEAELYNIGSRMYNCETYQFLQSDSYEGTLDDVLSQNSYAYCKGNPIKYYDPTGHFGELINKILSPASNVVSSIKCWGVEAAKTITSTINGSNSKSKSESLLRKGIARVRQELLPKVKIEIDNIGKNLRNFKTEQGALLAGAALIGAGALAMSCPPIGQGLVNAGLSVAFSAIDSCRNGTSKNMRDYINIGLATGVAGYIGGTIGMFGNVLGTTVMKKATVCALGDVATDVISQKLLTGKVDAKEAILSGAISFGLNYHVLKKATAVSNLNKQSVKTDSSIKSFLKDEEGGVDLSRFFKNKSKPTPETDLLEDVVNKGGSKTISYTDYDNIYQSSIHNVGKDKVMLGKYDGGGSTSYITKAGSEYEYFSLGKDWDTIKIKYGYTDDDMFKLFNESFLDDGINAGKTFQFSHNPVDDKGALGQEFKYLSQNNYLWDETTMTMIPKY